MAEAIKVRTTEEVVQAVFKNVKMAEESILNIMPKVKDEAFKSDLKVTLSAFEAFSSRATKLLADNGVKPKEEGTVTKLSAKWGTMMNTMRDSTTSHLAQMMVEGATMGVTEMMRLLRESENSGVSESALRLLRDVCAFEEKVAEDMKAYLR
jgi:hypothetical protein